MLVKAFGKINLTLEILNRKSDGYHNLRTLIAPLSIHDTIEIKVLKNSTESFVTCDALELHGDRFNLVSMAIDLLREKYNFKEQFRITIYKRLFISAGLGGGSSDCAFMIRMLNEMFGLGMSVGKMRETAATLGADCAFFIDPTPSFATGIGNRLEPADVNLDYYNIGVVKPRLMISTKEAFAHIVPRTPAICCRDIINKPVSQWKDILVNDFEQSVITEHPEIAEIKQTFYDLGAEYAAMSGSGSALFGIFRNVPKNFELAFKDSITYMVKTGMDISANQKNAL